MDTLTFLQTIEAYLKRHQQHGVTSADETTVYGADSANEHLIKDDDEDFVDDDEDLTDEDNDFSDDDEDEDFSDEDTDEDFTDEDFTDEVDDYPEDDGFSEYEGFTKEEIIYDYLQRQQEEQDEEDAYLDQMNS